MESTEINNRNRKLTTVEEAVSYVKPGMTLMIGGFLTKGAPLQLIDQLSENGIKNLTVIANDPGKPNLGLGKLIRNKQVNKLITSHIGLNPETGAQVQEGYINLHLVPQGSLVERIRCGGYGLGGVLTPVGIGTLAAEGKKTLKVDDREYLLELPLRADIALIKAHKGDFFGNLVFRGTSQNYNPIMAFAADLVIAEVDNLVEVLDPNEITTPGILVDLMVIKE